MNPILAFDCGGTRTRAGFYSADGALLREVEGGPANPIAQGVDAVAAEIERLVAALEPDGCEDIALGIAGARTADISESIWAAMAERFPATRIFVTDDQTPVLLANKGAGGAVLITAGTGSCVLAANASGKMYRKGGRGPLLGDDGSAYAISADALKRAARGLDGAALETKLSSHLPAAVGLKSFDELIGWQRSASRAAIAGLARTVTTLSQEGDSVARACLGDQAGLLASAAHAAWSDAKLKADASVILNGGVFEYCTIYAELVAQALKKLGCARLPALGERRGHAAVRELAVGDDKYACVIDRVSDAAAVSPLPITERKSTGPSLDSLDARGIVERMLRTDDDVHSAMVDAADAIAEAVELAGNAIRTGSRIIYAGAGTSGRLAVLDAAECRPTFGVESGRVIALIAGGEAALVESVEEAEDSRDAARADLDAIEPPINANDFVLGITASGTTPYACAIAEHAGSLGAHAALLTCNGESPPVAQLMIRLVTGPEALPGSTRLKAGTATKLALNIISTGAFARAGHIYDGWMVGVRPVNAKLRARAARILVALTGLNESAARELLQDSGNRIPVALVMQRFGIGCGEAETRLDAVHGELRAVLDD